MLTAAEMLPTIEKLGLESGGTFLKPVNNLYLVSYVLSEAP
jgi:hypothetical protein